MCELGLDGLNQSEDRLERREGSGKDEKKI